MGAELAVGVAADDTIATRRHLEEYGELDTYEQVVDSRSGIGGREDIVHLDSTLRVGQIRRENIGRVVVLRLVEIQYAIVCKDGKTILHLRFGYIEAGMVGHKTEAGTYLDRSIEIDIESGGIAALQGSISKEKIVVGRLIEETIEHILFLAVEVLEILAISREVGSHIGLGKSIETELNARHSIETLVLSAEHKRYLERDIGVGITAVAELAYIVEHIPFGIGLVCKSVRPSRYAEDGLPCGNTQPEVEQEMPGLQVVNKTDSPCAAHRRREIALTRKQRPFARFGRKTDKMFDRISRAVSERSDDEQKCCYAVFAMIIHAFHRISD